MAKGMDKKKDTKGKPKKSIKEKKAAKKEKKKGLIIKLLTKIYLQRKY